MGSVCPFSAAQSKSLPMRIRLKVKLDRVRRIGSNEGSKPVKIKPTEDEDRTPVLRRTESPKLRDLYQQSWGIGRGKGGRKLSVGGGLIKNAPEQGLKKWFKVHKCAVGLVKEDGKKRKNM